MIVFIDPSLQALDFLIDRNPVLLPEDSRLAEQTLEKVKTEGDKAIKQHLFQEYGTVISDLYVSSYEFEEAARLVDDDLKAAIQQIKGNVERFYSLQKTPMRKVYTEEGAAMWQRKIPYACAGIYIAPHTASLFSAVLTLGIPAVMAGCPRVVICAPPSAKGKIHPAILYAAQAVGIRDVYKAGEGFALAALAAGTETIPKSTKVFGTGGKGDMAMKNLLSPDTAIDMPGGQTECVFCFDSFSDLACLLADAEACFEHGPEAIAVAVTADAQAFADLQAKAGHIRSDRFYVFYFSKEENMIAFVNAFAPEQACLLTKNAEAILPRILYAGAVSIGRFVPEPAADYLPGRFAAFPSNGYARAYDSISLDSFTRTSLVMQFDETGFGKLYPAIKTVLGHEQLPAHLRALEARKKG